MKKQLLIIFSLLVCFASPLMAMTDKAYFSPQTEFDPEVPVPAEVLGYPVGSWHVRHDQLVSYMYAVAASSDRVSIEKIGESHEQRPLLLVTFSSPENIAKRQQIQRDHLQRVKQGAKAAADDPLVLWMGYSVHGNESSGANASLLIAYYLAAAQGEEVEALLDNAVIVMEPAINPDGLSRFAQWANMHKGNTLVGDPNHRDHNEGWPSGRTNHYWFDLNRDWLLLTHPESRARIAQFQQWRPHILTDFHEMGSHSTYFFQPGIPERKNPWINNQNVDMTNVLGQFHAEALDNQNELYFTQEAFDDFYLGKGSSYPDVQGTIGILFEQASSRGHLVDSINGPMTFADTIQNQVTISLSTFRGAIANKAALQTYQADFVSRTKELAEKADIGGYVIKASRDPKKNQEFLAILAQHGIDVWPLSRDTEVGNLVYRKNSDWFVPLQQAQYPLIRSLFSTQTSFEKNVFYDVSSWNIAMAFNLQYSELSARAARKLDKAEVALDTVQQPAWSEVAYAYGFDWAYGEAPALLQALLAKGVKVKLVDGQVKITSGAGQHTLSAGSVIVPAGLNQPADWRQTVKQARDKFNVPVHGITTGLTLAGNDLGSRSMPVLSAPKVMMLTGPGVSQYEAGETWHYLDNYVGLPLSFIDKSRLGRINLNDYTHILLVDGSYRDISDTQVKRLKQWVRDGGVVFAQKSAAKWLSDNEILGTKFRANKDVLGGFDTDKLRYEDMATLRAQQRIAGAVFSANIDSSHPLTFGLNSEQLALFRNSNLIMEQPESPFITVASYVSEPLLSGYAAEPLVGQVANSAAIVAHRYGRGRVIAMTDPANFRGYWRATQRLLSNAIYQAPLINAAN